jgi:hypothetical protein
LLQDASSKGDILRHTIETTRDNNREDFRIGQDLHRLSTWASENGKLQVAEQVPDAPPAVEVPAEAAGEVHVFQYCAPVLIAAAWCTML